MQREAIRLCKPLTLESFLTECILCVCLQQSHCEVRDTFVFGRQSILKALE